MTTAVVSGCCAAAAVAVLGIPARPARNRQGSGVLVLVPAVLGVALLAAVCPRAVPALAALGGAAAVTWLVRSLARRRRARGELRDAVPELCLILARELRAGATPEGALGFAAEIPDLARLLGSVPAQARLQVELPAALRERAAACGVDELRWVAACWEVAAQTGAALAAALEHVGDALHEARAHEREVASSLAAASSTVRLLAVLPVVGVALGAAVGVDLVTTLVRTRWGWACAGGASVLEALGLLWTSAITRRAAAW